MRLSSEINIVIMLAAAIVGLTACSANDKEVSFKSGGMTQTFTEGAATNIQGFPLPIYPNAKPTGEVQASSEADDNSKFLMLASNDKIDQISDFYNAKLKADGWNVKETLKQTSVINLGATKQDLEASVMVSADGDKSTISISVSKQSKDAPKTTGQVFTPDALNPPTD